MALRVPLCPGINDCNGSVAAGGLLGTWTAAPHSKPAAQITRLAPSRQAEIGQNPTFTSLHLIQPRMRSACQSSWNSAPATQSLGPVAVLPNPPLTPE
jgi:hypothetical protein